MPFVKIDYIGVVKLFPIPIPIPNLLPHHTTGKFRVQTGHQTVLQSMIDKLTIHVILVILVIIEIIVTKVIMALILKVVIKDRCVFKKWVRCCLIVIGQYHV